MSKDQRRIWIGVFPSLMLYVSFAIDSDCYLILCNIRMLPFHRPPQHNPRPLKGGFPQSRYFSLISWRYGCAGILSLGGWCLCESWIPTCRGEGKKSKKLQLQCILYSDWPLLHFTFPRHHCWITTLVN